LSTRVTIDAASDWLVANNPVALAKGSSHTLTSDLVLFSIVNFLMNVEPNWQFKRTEYTSNALGMTFIPPDTEMFSKTRQCAFFSGADFRSRLAQVKNLFAAAPGLKAAFNVPAFSNCRIFCELQPKAFAASVANRYRFSISCHLDRLDNKKGRNLPRGSGSVREIPAFVYWVLYV
jgi:hypothetical protein